MTADKIVQALDGAENWCLMGTDKMSKTLKLVQKFRYDHHQML